MVCKECQSCQKFVTNDCSGVKEFNKSSCEEMLQKKSSQVDVSGCC